MNAPPRVFDRSLIARRRARAARGPEEADFLLREGADGLADRLAMVNRSFARGVALQGRFGRLAEVLGETGKIESLIVTEGDPGLAAAGTIDLVCDDEHPPFADESVDLVASSLSLQWVNDLPGSFIQIRRALRPDGLFLAALLGGATLAELRETLMEAEMGVTGGAAPRVAPFADVREIGALMQRAGFALPVVDSDTTTVRYATMRDLMVDLRRMGWSNALVARSRAPLRRDVLDAAGELYAARYADSDGRIRATFEIINVSGWAPHESQQKPLAPGSAQMRLADALGVQEIGTGAKAAPSPAPRRSDHPPED